MKRSTGKDNKETRSQTQAGTSKKSTQAAGKKSSKPKASKPKASKPKLPATMKPKPRIGTAPTSLASETKRKKEEARRELEPPMSGVIRFFGNTEEQAEEESRIECRCTMTAVMVEQEAGRAFHPRIPDFDVRSIQMLTPEELLMLNEEEPADEEEQENIMFLLYNHLIGFLDSESDPADKLICKSCHVYSNHLDENSLCPGCKDPELREEKNLIMPKKIRHQEIRVAMKFVETRVTRIIKATDKKQMRKEQGYSHGWRGRDNFVLFDNMRVSVRKAELVRTECECIAREDLTFTRKNGESLSTISRCIHQGEGCKTK